MRADDLGHAGEELRRGRGAGGALRLRLDGHQMAVVAIAGAVLVRGIEPFRDQLGLAAGELAQPVEEIGREPALRAVDIIVERDRIDIRRLGADRRLIVIDRQPVAEEQRVGIGGLQRGARHFVVLPGDDAGPALDDRHAAARRRAAWSASRPASSASQESTPVRRHEIAREALPVVAIVLAQHRDPALLGEARRRLLAVEHEQRAVPPADFVVGEIADAIRRIAIRLGQQLRLLEHALLGGGIEGIEPVEAGEAAELQS